MNTKSKNMIYSNFTKKEWKKFEKAHEKKMKKLEKDALFEILKSYKKKI